MGGRRKGGKNKHSHFLYTVYDNRTDELIILDGTPEECARALGTTLNGWWTTLSRVRSGIRKKWHIEQRRNNGKT